MNVNVVNRRIVHCGLFRDQPALNLLRPPIAYTAASRCARTTPLQDIMETCEGVMGFHAALNEHSAFYAKHRHLRNFRNIEITKRTRAKINFFEKQKTIGNLSNKKIIAKYIFLY